MPPDSTIFFLKTTFQIPVRCPQPEFLHGFYCVSLAVNSPVGNVWSSQQCCCLLVPVLTSLTLDCDLALPSRVFITHSNRDETNTLPKYFNDMETACQSCVFPVVTSPEYAVRLLLPGREIFNKGHLKEVIRNLGSESVWAELGESAFSTHS